MPVDVDCRAGGWSCRLRQNIRSGTTMMPDRSAEVKGTLHQDCRLRMCGFPELPEGLRQEHTWFTGAGMMDSQRRHSKVT